MIDKLGVSDLNPTSIKRFGTPATQVNGNFTNLGAGLIDDLTMTYQGGTNKLSTVTDNAPLVTAHDSTRPTNKLILPHMN